LQPDQRTSVPLRSRGQGYYRRIRRSRRYTAQRINSGYPLKIEADLQPPPTVSTGRERLYPRAIAQTQPERNGRRSYGRRRKSTDLHQFTELGMPERYLRLTCHYNTYYIHGGTNRNKREQMIGEFQDIETEPSVFILSLKAGGVGITN